VTEAEVAGVRVGNLRQEHPERQSPPRSVLGAERAQRDRDRDARRRTNQHRHHAGGPAPAQAEAVEPYVDQEHPGRVRPHVGGPEPGGVGEDVVGESPQHVRDVANPRHVVQVLLTTGQPLHHTRCQPSTRAKARVHTTAAAHAVTSRRPQRRRAATLGPYRHTATAVTTATGVLGPACGSHCASSGGNGSRSATPSANRLRPATAAALTRPIPPATASRSGRTRPPT